MRNRTFILVAGFLLVLFVGAGALYVYDSSREDIVAEGVSVNGIDLGGLSSEEARDKLARSMRVAVSEPVVVERRDKRFRLSARRARAAVNVDAMVNEALRRSREGTIIGRTWRQLTGEEAHASIQPRVTFSERVVNRFVARVRRSIDRPARDATIEPGVGELTKVRSRTGLKVQVRALRADVEEALGSLGGDRTLDARVRRIEPAVTTRELADRYPTYLTIDRGNFRLRYYKKLKLKETYPIAVGAIGRETPPGLYDISNKAVNPSWSVPNSDWAGELAGRVIPPGPSNPLKERWLGIYGGVGIHGTAETGSIGTNASKGCIRMLIPDVIELYDRVPVGTPVYIA